MKITCAGCRTVVEQPDRVGFRDICPSCGAWLHSCVNCAFLVDGLCVEPAAEKVRDPEGQNFCDWFREVNADAAGERAQNGGRDAAEDMWKKLTKK